MKKLFYGLMGLWGLLNLVQAHDNEVVGSKRTRSPEPTATTHRAHRSEDLEPLYQGQYVTVKSDGKVHIHQKRYPVFKDNPQFFACSDDITYMNGKYYHEVGAPVIRDEMIFWNQEEIEPSDVPFVAQPVEAQLTDEPYAIVPEEECKESPYFSCGRLNISFPPDAPGEPNTKGRGSAAAIDQNILVTAAHNFMPPTWKGAPNNDKVRAANIRFLHVKTKGKERVACEVSTAHCFIHPKWEESFDPHHDIAFIFLNQSLTSTQEEKDRLLRLHVLSPALEHGIQVVGYPLGVSDMRRTNGEARAREDRPIDAMSVVYHTANTEQGSSGSPIVKDGKSLMGVHTRGPSPGGTMNRGVRIRLDLMPFLDGIVKDNQKYLADAEAYEVEKAEKKAQLERQRIREIEERGANEEKIRLAKALMNLLNDETISEKTNLPLNVVKALRTSGVS